MKICKNRHLTGCRRCVQCRTTDVENVHGYHVTGRDKRAKKAIERAIIEAGGVPERIRRRR